MNTHPAVIGGPDVDPVTSVPVGLGIDVLLQKLIRRIIVLGMSDVGSVGLAFDD